MSRKRFALNYENVALLIFIILLFLGCLELSSSDEGSHSKYSIAQEVAKTVQPTQDATISGPNARLDISIPR